MLKTLVVRGFQHSKEYGEIVVQYAECNTMVTSEKDMLESINFYNELLAGIDDYTVQYELLDIVVEHQPLSIWTTHINTIEKTYAISLNCEDTERGLL